MHLSIYNHVHIYMYIHTYMHTYIYVYMIVYRYISLFLEKVPHLGPQYTIPSQRNKRLKNKMSPYGYTCN